MDVGRLRVARHENGIASAGPVYVEIDKMVKLDNGEEVHIGGTALIENGRTKRACECSEFLLNICPVCCPCGSLF